MCRSRSRLVTQHRLAGLDAVRAAARRQVEIECVEFQNDAAFLRDELAQHRQTDLGARIQKNINLLTLEGHPAPPLELTETLGAPLACSLTTDLTGLSESVLPEAGSDDGSSGRADTSTTSDGGAEASVEAAPPPCLAQVTIDTPLTSMLETWSPIARANRAVTIWQP